jgi:hypothetical protein
MILWVIVIITILKDKIPFAWPPKRLIILINRLLLPIERFAALPQTVCGTLAVSITNQSKTK